MTGSNPVNYFWDGPLIGYIEALEFSRIILPLHFDFINGGQVRPFITPCQNGVNGTLLALKDSFHRAVGSVPYPARNTKAFSNTLRLRPEKNSLNPSGYNYMGTDFVFHGHLTNIWLGSYDAWRLEG
jgi:hypothetical protein